MKRRALLAIIVLGMIGSVSSFGNEYTDQVKAQLAMIKLAGLTDGWQETHNDKFDRLDDGDDDSFSFSLNKGMKYKIIAVCDADCDDLDLTLFDENGNEISKDDSTDSFPIVEVTPRWTGKFSLQVEMYSCRDNPCYYGISILGK